MENKITTYGKLIFDPPEYTKKHKSQGEWKKIAIIELQDDSAKLYSWFLNKRFNIEFNPPLRGSHLTLINDSIKDLSSGGKLTKEEVENNWNRVKSKWDGKEIEIKYLVEPKTNDEHWWINIAHEDRGELHDLRAELGLGKPFWGLHITVGIIHPHSIQHSSYIHQTLISQTMDDMNAVSAYYSKKILERELVRKTKKEKMKSIYTKKQYNFISELLWGGIPENRDWAEETTIFKTNAPKLLNKYPNLDISFFYEMKLNYRKGKKRWVIEKFIYKLFIENPNKK